MSVSSWAIIYQKQRCFRRALTQSRDFLKLYRRCERWIDAYPFCEQFRESPLVGIFLAAYQQTHNNTRQRENGDALNRSTSLPAIEREMKRAALAETNRLESQVPWLASVATSSPFIGLFGTVVGIIISFQGLALETQTSIQAVAPGIAEALVATAAGLFVAVPAYMAYNHHVSKLRHIAGISDNFCLELINSIEGGFAGYGVLKS
jgi:biopolymer transport protein TolQ